MQTERSFTDGEKLFKLAGGIRVGFSEVPRNGFLLHKKKSMAVSRPVPGQNVMRSVA